MRTALAILAALALYGCTTPEPRMERTAWTPPLGPLVVEVGNDAWCAERWGVDGFWRADCLADLGIIRLRWTRRDGRLLPSAYALGHETGHLLWPELPEEALR